MKGIDQKELEQKLNLVIEKLMHLGGPEDEADLEAGGEKIGFFRRDFGIHEWDWPQGVGLYGLLKIMKIKSIRTFYITGLKTISVRGFPLKISIQPLRF